MIYDVIIVGGGASGLFCANYLLAHGFSNFLILEQQDNVGKKILASGNGRCNVSNQNMTVSFYNHSTIEPILNRYTTETVMSFFAELGLETKIESGRYYPLSNQAVSVQQSLFEPIKDYVLLNCLVTDIKRHQHFVVETSLGHFNAKHVVLAVGGLSGLSPKVVRPTQLLETMQLKQTPCHPGIVQFYVKEDMMGLKGIRIQATLTLKDGQDILIKDTGEVQLTNHGLSGIPAMQLSRYINKDGLKVMADFFPNRDALRLEKLFLNQQHITPHALIKQLGIGTFHQSFISWILRRLEINRSTIGELTIDDIKQIVAYIKQTPFSVDSLFDYDYAQVTVGGVDLAQINIETLSFLEDQDMYICGEAMDIDGYCGGYNLHWAWTSGMHVAQMLLKKVKKT